MNNKKIAFIICVNNEIQYAEALYYLDRLIVPMGYEKDVIAVREAPSMAAGYNAGMQSSDAKYKVYLHQDVFIINRNFIEDLITTFQKDEKLGMLGCIGCENLPLHARAVEAWNAGMIYHNCSPGFMNKILHEDRKITYVEALDGVLLATQYDIVWREDLFDGWDFYDISQCFEMKRAGYNVATVFQEQPWCYHDNMYSKFLNYQKYCARFATEYQDMKPFCVESENPRIVEYEALKTQSIQNMRAFVEAGKKDALCSIFNIAENKGYLHLRNFEILATIDKMEQKAGESCFWRKGDSYEELLEKIRSLKYAIKRIEYLADEDGSALDFIVGNFSIWAVDVVYTIYKVYRPETWQEITERFSLNMW